MKWQEVLRIGAEEPAFSSSLLLSGQSSPASVHLQLTRWVAQGKLIQLRRGVYTLADPYRKRSWHPFLLANRMQRGSYVGLQSALAHYGLIPEHVAVVTSVTTGRSAEIETRIGAFAFRHVQTRLFRDYRRIEVAPGQWAVVSTPEKSLLDLIYLTPGGETAAYIEELRLERLDRLDLDRLTQLASDLAIPKLQRAARRLRRLAAAEHLETL